MAGAPNDGVLNENEGAADAAPKPPNDVPKPPNAGCAEKSVNVIYLKLKCKNVNLERKKQGM